MTSTLPGADIRSYYAALGIQLPNTTAANVNVRCFADPDAHQHGDRNPSCSVSIEHAAWKCHGCGAEGGAYDAAKACGRSTANAYALLVAYGIAPSEPQRSRRPRRHHALRVSQRSRNAAKPLLSTCDADVERWHAALQRNRLAISQLAETRGWRRAAILELELGFDGGRITIPIRDEHRGLQGVLRYQPRPGRLSPKMIAVPGTRLGLIPDPTREPSTEVILTEGPPDMVAARSAGLPAIAVPGDHAWRSEWASPLADRNVTIVVDSDDPGRAFGERAARHLDPFAIGLRVVDLAPHRNDGYDLSDALLEHDNARILERLGVQPLPRVAATPTTTGR